MQLVPKENGYWDGCREFKPIAMGRAVFRLGYSLGPVFVRQVS